MDARATVIARCEGKCERCGRDLEDVPASVHHRRPRGMGGTSDLMINAPENLVVLCGSGTTGCHGWVESNRELAISYGWLVPRRDIRHPGDVPVFTRCKWWWVTRDAIIPADLAPPF